MKTGPKEVRFRLVSLYLVYSKD